MENIDEVRRVEALARELVKHKIAENMQDAVAQAESMIKGKGKADIQKPESKDVNKEAKRDVNENAVRVLSSHLNQQKSMTAELQSKMNEMITEINNLRRDVNELRTRVNARDFESGAKQHSDEQKPESKGRAEIHGTAAQTAQPVRGEGAKPERRTGEFKPGDFKIHEIFYTGSKKK